jgi:hypothetical protein
VAHAVPVLPSDVVGQSPLNQAVFDFALARPCSSVRGGMKDIEGAANPAVA